MPAQKGPSISHLPSPSRVFDDVDNDDKKRTHRECSNQSADHARCQWYCSSSSSRVKKKKWLQAGGRDRDRRPMLTTNEMDVLPVGCFHLVSLARMCVSCSRARRHLASQRTFFSTPWVVCTGCTRGESPFLSRCSMLDDKISIHVSPACLPAYVPTLPTTYLVGT